MSLLILGVCWTRADLRSARLPVSVGGGRARVLLLRLKLHSLDATVMFPRPPVVKTNDGSEP